MVSVDEYIESDEKTTVKVMKSVARSMDEGMKKEKINGSPKTYLKNTTIVKKNATKKSPVSQKRKMEVNIVEKKSLKRKLVQSSDSRTNVEANVQDIVSTARRKVREK